MDVTDYFTPCAFAWGNELIRSDQVLLLYLFEFLMKQKSLIIVCSPKHCSVAMLIEQGLFI